MINIKIFSTYLYFVQLLVSGAVLHSINTCHKSWGSPECLSADTLYEPSSLKEIQDLITQARDKKKTMRFIGAGYSNIDIINTTDWLVKTYKFNKILHLDKEHNIVCVQTGVTIRELLDFLASEGLTLQNQSLIIDQTIGGALATGTHGTGKNALLSDSVKALELVDGMGNMRSLSRDIPIFSAAIVHLGALGFVYSIMLQCVPLFVVNHERFVTNWQDVKNRYKELVDAHDYVMLFGHPYDDRVLVYVWDKDRTNNNVTDNYLYNAIESIVLGDVSNYIGSCLADMFPMLMNRLTSAILSILQRSEHREYNYKSLSFAPQREPDFYKEGEFAIPVDNFCPAIDDIRAIYQELKRECCEPVGFIFCRFTPGQKNALLAQDYQRETAYLSFPTVGTFNAYKSFYEKLQDKLRTYSARPHWGKYHTYNATQLRAVYGSGIDVFSKIRKEFDPHGIFDNNYIAHCFDS